MKVVQVAPGIGKEAAGLSYSAPKLCDGLLISGCEVELHFLGLMPKRVFNCPISCYPVRKFPFRQLCCSPKMLQGLRNACQTADIIHSNSLWMMPNIYPEWAIRGTKCKLVVQPHGTLSKWAMRRSWWKKLPLWWLWQKRVLDKAEMFVATCDKEYKEIRALGYKQPVAIVPIGMEVPTLEEKPQNTQKTQKGPCGQDCQCDLKTTEHTEYTEGCCAPDCQCGDKTTEGASHQLPLATEHNRLRRIVFFGRIHKVKAVDHLVKAWGKVQKSLPEWELVIAGPDCGAKGELETIIAEEQIPRVRFVGEINGPAKYDFLTDADIYVLPSHTENFGVTVAEALACGTPTIASQGTPWEGLETEKCGKWVPIGVGPLVEALRELTSLTDDERVAMGERGRAWIQRDFSWDGIGAKMKAAYAWLLGQGEKPDFVRVD